MRPLSCPRTVDVDAMTLRTAHLTLKEVGAYERLWRHYWRWGSLLPEDRQLASICRVNLQAFLSMRGALELLFEPDATGRWRAYAFEEERAAALEGVVRA